MHPQLLHLFLEIAKEAANVILHRKVDASQTAKPVKFQNAKVRLSFIS